MTCSIALHGPWPKDVKMELPSKRHAPRGVGGLNLWGPWACYRMGPHAQIFFPRGGDLKKRLNSEESNDQQHQRLVADRQARGSQNLLFVFRTGPVKPAQKCREIQGGGVGSILLSN